MEQSTVFKSNKSQAIRLPKAVAPPEVVKETDFIKPRHTGLNAPHAIRVGLVTNNPHEFQRVPGLRLENWVQ